MSERDRQIEAFLETAGWNEAQRTPLRGDASTRRYVRLRRQVGQAILMDAPPPQEKVREFHDIDLLLAHLGFSTPGILASDLERGFLLLEDFGDRTFTRILAEGGNEAELYRLATDTLIELHRCWPGSASPAGGAAIPAYSDEILLEEVGRFAQWYLPAVLGHEKAAALEAEFLELWRATLPAARCVPETLILRDYHVDNLMVLSGRADTAACGLLDFQDAVTGPLTYDPMSLICDVRRDVSPGVARDITARYLDAFPELPAERFEQSFAVLSAQRNVKIIGNFARLLIRDGKPTYLDFIPRTWRLVEEAFEHPALAQVREWFDEAVPAQLRTVPGADSASGHGGTE